MVSFGSNSYVVFARNSENQDFLKYFKYPPVQYLPYICLLAGTPGVFEYRTFFVRTGTKNMNTERYEDM